MRLNLLSPGRRMFFMFVFVPVFSMMVLPVSAEEGPTYSIRTFSSTVGLDPAVGQPWREHRGADLLDPSGEGDEPFFIDPGPGPDVQVEAPDVLLIPAVDADAAEVDAISASYDIPLDHFYLAFSVDFLRSEGVEGDAPFNVKQQWEMNHPEGDIFFALPEMKIGHAIPVPANLHIDAAGVGNTHSFSTLYRSNQTEFDLGPRAAPDQAWLDEELYDDIDAFDFHSFMSSAIPFPDKPLYLSVDEQTALNNAANLPAVTGGDILVCEMAGIFMWAPSWDLGLMTTDDIDALVVFGDQNLEYDPSDVVLFSLHPDSPTLANYGFSAADVLVAHWQAPPTLFASAVHLGLRAEDDLDALAPVFEEAPFLASSSIPVSRSTLNIRSYPNPFNPMTTLSYSFESKERGNSLVRLEIFDITGRRVRTLVDEQLPAGNYTSSWDGTTASGSSVASGIFYGRLLIDDRMATSKMVLIR